MNGMLWRRLLIVLLAASVAVFVGCKEDDESNPAPVGPGAPTLGTPADGATDVAVNPTILTWSSVAAATGYQLHVATDAQFSNMVVNQDVATATTYSVNDLDYEQMYYWEVEARDASGYTSLSATRSFTTIGALYDTWDAQDNWLDSVGVDQMRYTFETNSDYTWFYSVGTTSITRSGTFSAGATQITFHETNNDGTPVDTMYTRDYALTGGNDVLVLEYRDGSTVYDIEYDRLP